MSRLRECAAITLPLCQNVARDDSIERNTLKNRSRCWIWLVSIVLFTCNAISQSEATSEVYPYDLFLQRTRIQNRKKVCMNYGCQFFNYWVSKILLSWNTVTGFHLIHAKSLTEPNAGFLSVIPFKIVNVKSSFRWVRVSKTTPVL